MRLLDLAPHCQLPPRDGADRRTWRLFEGLQNVGVHGTLVVRSGTITGSEQQLSPYRSGGEISKLKAAMAAIIRGSDYWQTKMLGRSVRESVDRLAGESFTAVLVNFLYATPLLSPLRGRSLKLIIDTHNYDPSVFGGFAAATRNPLTRLLCRRAIRTSRQALAALPDGTVLVHVSAADAEQWRRDRPDLVHEVIDNGCDLAPRTTCPDYAAETKQLLFVGSLSAQMNQDALRHFASAFWPELRAVARLRVVGSAPSPSISKLCRRLGWELRANVSDAELSEAYADSHFAILPFEYGAGSKLKLFEAIGRGLPVLATPAGVVGASRLPRTVFQAARSEEWLRHIRETREWPSSAQQEALAYASGFSWSELAKRLNSIIAAAPQVIV
jgi:glycosyltransferase involved in cell wall biosynthesis